MLPDDEVDPRELPEGDGGPLPNRVTHGTLIGCLGICCVLAMPVLLFLPLESWDEPFWMQLLVPLVAFGSVALGTALLARVPPGILPRSRDPRFPLTGAGALPLRETPATVRNRLALCVVGLLCLLIALGVLLAVASGAEEPALLAGVLVAGAAGVLLALDGAVVALHRAPIPAWRWIRAPVQARRTPRGTPLALAGVATALWALLMLAYAGLVVGAVGMALLLLAGVLAAPLAQRTDRHQPPHAVTPDGASRPTTHDA